MLLREIYDAVDELEAMFPGRHFTPDGHMVGSLGEALAQYHYRIELSGASAYCHDGICEGRRVQIKATQGNRVALSSEPEHLLVLSLKRDGSFSEEYNGPGAPVWALVAHKPRPKNGQYQVTLSALRRLMRGTPHVERLGRRDAEHVKSATAMTSADEFSTVDLILNSGSVTLGVDAFALSVIKAERQARKILTYLVYQFPVFSRADAKGLRCTLAANKRVDFQGVLAGLDALSPVSARDLVGPEYDKLKARFDEFKRHRNKIFHGQVTADGLPRSYLLEAVADIKIWCRNLGASAAREFGYDGFVRNSFRKSDLPDVSSRLRVQINSLEEYAGFIAKHMQRSNSAVQRTGGSRCSAPATDHGC